MRGLNLARDPFVNRRPVRRLAVVVWLLALALLALNARSYWQHFVGQDRRQSELSELEPKIAEERRQLDAAMELLAGYDLPWQREQIAFLNAKIAERTFSWSALFDHLSEVLPRNVRIERVTPQISSRRRARGRRQLRAAEDEVLLEFTGAATEDDALLVLIDAFFAHERFRRPNLKVEARGEGGREVAFSMTVSYQPVAPQPPPKKVAEAAADGASSGEGARAEKGPSS